MKCFDSLRDYFAAMEAQNNLLRVPEMDQEKYEMSCFMYRLDDEMKDRAPAILCERTKMEGKWHETPVVSNILNSFATVAQCFGIEDVSGSNSAIYKRLFDHIMSFQDRSGRWKTIDPVVVEGSQAPCKQHKQLGDDVDITAFPWIKNNPADGGRYISSGCVIIEDPELGRNVGTYRLMVKKPGRVGVCMTFASHGNQFMMKAAERGEMSVKASIAVGVDPMTFMMSSTRLGDLGEDEFGIAGGFRGKAVELVKSETNDILVPAHAEFIIEGTIPLDQEEEGPYGEMLGYIGEKGFTYYMDIEAVTHRQDPWVYNLWPGIGGAYLTLPWEVGNYIRIKRILPGLVGLHTAPASPSVLIASIDKKMPGEGMEAGMALLGYRGTGFAKKAVIVVDKDVDVTDMDRVLHAVGTRWQPNPASLVVPNSFHFPLDPSTEKTFTSSKIVIDATRQMQVEGGPEDYAEDNRSVMNERAADGFALVEERWTKYFEGTRWSTD